MPFEEAQEFVFERTKVHNPVWREEVDWLWIIYQTIHSIPVENQKIAKFAKDKKIVDRDIAAMAYASDKLGINIKQKKYSINGKVLNQVQIALQSGPQIIIKEKKVSAQKKTSKPKKNGMKQLLQVEKVDIIEGEIANIIKVV